MTERPKHTRRGDPVLDRLKKSPDFITSVMNEMGLPAIAPDDPVTDELLTGAVEKAVVEVQPTAVQRQAHHEQYAARTPAGRAAQGLVEEAKAQEAKVDPAELKAVMSQWTPEEKESIFNALVEESSEASRIDTSLEDYEPQVDMSALDEVEDEGFQPVWDDSDIEVVE